MATKARLKFKNNIPIWLEHKLMNEGGFHVFSRDHHTNWLIVAKDTGPPAPSKKIKHSFDVIENGELSQSIQADLRRRCNYIACSYEEPEKHETAIRAKLNNLMLSLTTARQRSFVQIWIQNNIDAEDFFGVG